MKHLFECLKSYRKEAILSPLLKLLEVVMELTVPLVVAAIVDVGIGGGDKGYILHACLLLMAFAAGGLCFALLAQYFAAKAAVGTASALRSRLFHKLNSLSYSQIDRIGTPQMITRMTSDVAQIQTGINLTLRLVLRSPLVVFGAMALAFVVDVKVALVFVAVIPLLALAVGLIMAVGIPLFKKVQERLDKVYLSTRENLTGVRVIRAFSMEEGEKERFRDFSQKLFSAQRKAGKYSALTGPITFILVNLATIALLYFGGVRVNGGALEQGKVIALYGYMSQILIELLKLANLIVSVTKAISCQKRIGEILDLPEEPEKVSPAEKSGEIDDAVSFEHVSFRYGGANALEDISFHVKKGTTLGILGGTGAGKSTLVNLLPRFYEASEGKVSLFGEDVGGVSYQTLRKEIGLVPQQVVLFKGTIRSNLLWGNETATDEELLYAAKCAQAEDILLFKGGLDAEVEEGGRNFSGGQRQRLTIARALVKKPKLLILDDSFSALDYATDKKLRTALKELDCTKIIVSQRASTVRDSDLILVLDGGRCEGLGTHNDLLKTSRVYREILSSQEGERA